MLGLDLGAIPVLNIESMRSTRRDGGNMYGSPILVSHVEVNAMFRCSATARGRLAFEFQANSRGINFKANMWQPVFTTPRNLPFVGIVDANLADICPTE